MQSTTEPLSSVVIIGAGTMGAGIAAHLANLGLSVTLADISESAAQAGLTRAKNNHPPQFMSTEAADRIKVLDLDALESEIPNAQWICEAIFENLEAKQQLFARIAPLVGTQTLISSNTSGLPVADLAEALPPELQSRFVGTHFFNPPRYLKLLELIPSRYTKPEVVNQYVQLFEKHLARRVVIAKDTPGFIANRFGMWSLYQSIKVAESLGLTVEEADAITGQFIGRPKSGTFRLADVIGLDVMNDIASNLLSRCSTDPEVGAFTSPKSLAGLLELGWKGSKSGQGFYRKEGKELLSIDLGRMSYRPFTEAKFSLIENLKRKPLQERLQEGLASKDEVGEFLRLALLPSLKYANSILAEVAHNPLDFDRVMQWGFGWEIGPFAIIDLLGADKCGIKSQPFYSAGQVLSPTSGQYSPISPEPDYITLNQLPVIESLENLTVYQASDGVQVVAIDSKMGSISPSLCKEIQALINQDLTIPRVLCSSQPAFSVGFDLRCFINAIESENFDEIDEDLVLLQSVGELLGQSKTVAALHGYALGGGLELAISCPQVVTLSEAKLGFPESRVGLLPAGRGCTTLRTRFQSNLKECAQAALTICQGQFFENARLAQKGHVLRESDIIEFHPDRLLFTAINLAKELVIEEQPKWKPVPGPLAGMIDQLVSEAKAKGLLTSHDATIGDSIKQVFAKSTSYEDSLARERTQFVDLCKNALTVARIKAFFETGKPLRN